jgi:hypothetical protein
MNNLHCITDQVVLLFESSKGSQYGVVNTLDQNDFLKRINNLRPLRLLILDNDSRLPSIIKQELTIRYVRGVLNLHMLLVLH